MEKLLEKLKKLLGLSKKSAGFTLIELLVVIGILGILAAALVATIDPFEQLNKATDANVKNTVVEYINANIRYFTTHQAMPWHDSALNTGCQTGLAGGAPSQTSLTDANMVLCTGDLISDGELKASFSTATNILKNIYITEGANNSVIACFLPVSKSQLKDPNTKYSKAGVAVGNQSTDCAAYGGATTCYWCSQ
jgi:prepilin-type N-terminal cleavage/methylation domain-containing protein